MRARARVCVCVSNRLRVRVYVCVPATVCRRLRLTRRLARLRLGVRNAFRGRARLRTARWCSACRACKLHAEQRATHTTETREMNGKEERDTQRQTSH